MPVHCGPLLGALDGVMYIDFDPAPPLALANVGTELFLPVSPIGFDQRPGKLSIDEHNI